MASFLTSALVIGAVAGAPLGAQAKSKKEYKPGKHVDWGVINEVALAAALEKQGVLKKDASTEEIQEAILDYVSKAKVPGSNVDEEDLSDFEKEIRKTKKAFNQFASGLVNGTEQNRKIQKFKFRDVHTDNAVVALIEFPDLQHNQLPKPEKNEYLWTQDFNQAHYDKLLFNQYGYKTPEGIELTTMTQYYYEQSAGSWQLDGTVTPWLTAKHNAAYYGGNNAAGNDANPRALVAETLENIGRQIAGEEWKYDQRDPYDIDGDKNVMEPDGLLDNLFVVHSGVGEDSGGGILGPDAIWAHRWNLPRPTEIPGTSLKAFDYIIQGEEGSAGVFAHEYGHNLGLPDEYDTSYSGNGEPVAVWSIMSAGSWAGKIPGTEPTGFSPYAKLWLHEVYGGNWPRATEINYADMKLNKSYRYKLKEAVADTADGKLLKINLPDRAKEAVTQPKQGKYSYFSNKGDNLDTKLISQEIDLTGAKDATLEFDSWRQIETGYDYLSVNVAVYGDKAETVKLFDDDTQGKWVSDEIDLSRYAGQKIQLEFNYVTDGGLAPEGFYVDNIEVKADGDTVFRDDAEDEPKFELKGFKKFDGSPSYHPNFYLVEWRSHNGVDEALAHYRRNDSFLIYDPGMVIWYYDGRYDINGGADNMTGMHPGEGFLSVVDAHQRPHYWSDGELGSARYQIADAAFGKKKTSPINVQYPDFYMSYPGLKAVYSFSDQTDYSALSYSPKGGGVILPVLGVNIRISTVNRAGNEVTFTVSKTKVKPKKKK
jgi:immune inhibitor A